MTAVEYLYKIIHARIHIDKDLSEYYEKAKEMEKQQIIDAVAQYEIKHNKVLSEQGILNVVNKAEQYYNAKYCV